MQIEKFEIEFLDDLKNNDKKSCIKKLDENKNFLQISLGEKASYETIKHFIDGINNIIVVTTKKFSLFEKIFKHEALARVFRVWKDSDVLVKACKEKNKDACKWLLSMNVKMDTQDEDGMTALMYAVKDDKLDFVVEELINNKDSLNLNLVDKNGENAVFHALCNPKATVELFNELLWRGNINVNQVNKNGDTALLYCCKNEIYEPIRFLVSKLDINVNIKDDRGKTAAMYLAEKSRGSEFKKIMYRNCDFSYISKTGESVLSIAFYNIYSIYAPKEENDNKQTWYIQNNLRIMYSLMSTNCNFNIPLDEDGNTLIMILILVNDFNTLSFLLSSDENNKIDLSVKNNYGENASSLCVKQNNYTKFYRLKKHSTFDFGYVDPNNNNTMLMLAAMSKPEFIQELIEFDVNTINEANVVGENALILGVKANQLLSVTTLLKHHINVNHQDIQGNTALHYAVEQKDVNIISELMKYQADANLKNREGKSAFDIAHEIGDKTILNAIREPSSVVESNEPVKDHEPSTRYEEVIGYLRPNIRNYHTDFKMTNSFSRAESIVINEMKSAVRLELPMISWEYRKFFK